MAGLDPGLYLQGTLFDGNPLWNMEALMPVRMGTESTPLMSPSEIQNQVMLRTSRFNINELINGLMADRKIWVF
jgi:hypothetical protein